jgi:hypothetical protein
MVEKEVRGSNHCDFSDGLLSPLRVIGRSLAELDMNTPQDEEHLAQPCEETANGERAPRGPRREHVEGHDGQDLAETRR